MVVRYLNGPQNPASIQTNDGDSYQVVTSGETQTITGVKSFSGYLKIFSYGLLGAVSAAGSLTSRGSFVGTTAYNPAAVLGVLSGNGSIGPGSYYTGWTTTGDNTATLSDGVVGGQLKKIAHVSDGGSGVLTITTAADGASADTLTFTAVGDYAVLMWVEPITGVSASRGWRIIELGNTVDPSTGGPTIS
jgi:hypothetical protein